MKKIFLLLLLHSFIAIPQIYESHPKISLTLGYGIDIKDLSNGKVFTPFKSGFRTRYENPEGTVKTEFYQSLILTEDDLNKSYRIDAAASARYLGFNASASYNIDKREILNDKSLTVQLSCENNYGNEFLDVNESDLTLEAENLLRNKEYENFVNKYGNYIVNKVEHVSRINVYVTLKNIERETRESISKTASAGGSFGKFSGSLSASINSAIITANSNRNVQISIQSNGDSNGFKDLKELIDVAIQSSDPIKTISETLKSYLDKFTRKASPVSKYYLSSVSSFGVPNQYINWNSTSEELLNEIALQYKSLQLLKEQNDLIINSGSIKTIISYDEKNKLQNEKSSVSKSINSLLALKDKCLNVCQIQGTNLINCCDPSTVLIPNIPTTNKYISLLAKLITSKETGITLDKGQEYTLFDEYINGLKDKKVNVFIRLYFIPDAPTGPYESNWNCCMLFPLNFELKINDVTVLVKPQLEKVNIVPYPIFDNASRNIIGYTNQWIFEVDNFQIIKDSLKISLKFNDFGAVDNYTQVKIHPGLFIHTEIRN